MEAATRKGRQGKNAEKVWRGRARFQNQGGSFREGRPLTLEPRTMMAGVRWPTKTRFVPAGTGSLNSAVL